jgi:uncharacterized protein (DUF433 family)
MRPVVESEDKFNGEEYLEDTRIRVSDIAVKYEKLRYSIDELLEAYERLERADIHNALAYYYRNEESFSLNADQRLKT